MNLAPKFAAVELTDTGMVRDHNEDAIGSTREEGLYVLADGMGGYNAGEIASKIAVETVIKQVNEACQREDPWSREAAGRSKRYADVAGCSPQRDR